MDKINFSVNRRSGDRHGIIMYSYAPDWRIGRGGGAVAAKRMLKAQFDHKQLLVFLPDKVSTSMNALLKGAEKKGIPVIRKSVPSRGVTAPLP